MKIHLIIGQRKERYLGEYAPEVLDAMDEYGNDENSGEWIDGKMKEHKADESFEAVEVVTVEVPISKIMERLRPNNKPIATTVVA